MASAHVHGNGSWGALRLHAELRTLGIDVSERTASRPARTRSTSTVPDVVAVSMARACPIGGRRSTIARWAPCAAHWAEVLEAKASSDVVDRPVFRRSVLGGVFAQYGMRRRAEDAHATGSMP